MKLRMLPLLLAGIAGSAFATTDPVAVLQAAKNMPFKFVGATYDISSNGMSLNSGTLPASNVAISTKAAASLTASTNLSSLYSAVFSSDVITLTGTNKTGGKLQFAVSSPTIIGKTLSVTVSGITIPIVVNTFSGSLNVVARMLPAPTTSSDGVQRIVGFDQDPSAGSTITITGTGTVAPFGSVPVTLTFKPVVGAGLGGVTTKDYVTSATFNASFGGVQLAAIEGGQTGVLTMNLKTKAPAAGTITLTKNAGATAVTLPASASVVTGATKVIVNVPTVAVTTSQFVQITASYNGFVMHSSPAFVAPKVALMTITGTGTLGNSSGSALTGKISLITPTASALSIQLFSSDPNIVIPASVSIAAGKSSATFTVKTYVSTAPYFFSVVGLLPAPYNFTVESGASLTP